MRSTKSNANSKRSSLLALLFMLLTMACAPTVQDCHAILPVPGAAATLTRTPADTPGCSCITDGVLVVAEARRSGFSWVRGRLWIDGIAVPEQEFTTRLAEAKARRQIETAAAHAKGTAAGIKEEARKVGERIKGLFRR
jgi:hypothetical protein